MRPGTGRCAGRAGSQRSALGGVSRALRSGWGPAWSATSRVAVRSRLRLARSLLVTPWFAAGAGIVIAAALAVNTPTALTYGPTGPGGLCTTHSCTGSRRPQPPQVATASPGVAIRDPSADAKGGGAAPDPPGVTEMNAELSYQICWRSGRGFTALITMPGAGKTGWSLQFAFPGAHVRHVMGARWHPSRDGAGGTAIRPAPRGNRSSPASDPGQPGVPAGPGPPDADQMVVIATGRPQIAVQLHAGRDQLPLRQRQPRPGRPRAGIRRPLAGTLQPGARRGSGLGDPSG